MIQLQNVAKTFKVGPAPGRPPRVVQAVRDLTLAIEPGTIVGVVGPNGAGKSTLFGLLLGFLEATAGEITIDDTDPRKYIRKHGASYLPERFQLPREWTVRMALEGLLRLDKSTRNVDDVIEEWDLGAFEAAAAHTLSRGTLQRVGVAQALASPRNVVVLDEPTEGLDPIWRLRLRESIHKLRANDRYVLIASHDLNEIERVADRVLILNDGAITETVDLRARAGEKLEYAVTLTAPHESLPQLFPDARDAGNNTWIVASSDAADLNTRIAALIESGAIILSFAPAVDLEQRVARAARPERT
jgi:ABC-type multidrug transport system ATPase subunit